MQIINSNIFGQNHFELLLLWQSSCSNLYLHLWLVYSMLFTLAPIFYDVTVTLNISITCWEIFHRLYEIYEYESIIKSLFFVTAPSVSWCRDSRTELFRILQMFTECWAKPFHLWCRSHRSAKPRLQNKASACWNCPLCSLCPCSGHGGVAGD